MKKALFYLEIVVGLFYTVYFIYIVNNYRIAGLFTGYNRNWAISFIAMYIIKAVFMIGVIELIRRIIIAYHKI